VLYVVIFGDDSFTTFYACSDVTAEIRAHEISGGKSVRYVRRAERATSMLYVVIFGDDSSTTFHADNDVTAEIRARDVSGGKSVRYVARVIAS
jgi:hypothetical protein